MPHSFQRHDTAGPKAAARLPLMGGGPRRLLGPVPRARLALDVRPQSRSHWLRGGWIVAGVVLACSALWAPPVAADRVWSSGFELTSTTDGMEFTLNAGSPSAQGTTDTPTTSAFGQRAWDASQYGAQGQVEIEAGAGSQRSGWTQRIERRQTAGFSGAQQARADVRADEDGQLWRQAQCGRQDQRIGGSQIVLEDQAVRLRELLLRDIKQMVAADLVIDGDAVHHAVELGLGQVARAVDAIEGRERLRDGQDRQDNGVRRVINEGGYDVAADLRLVVFQEGAGIKEIQHRRLPAFLPHARDFVGQAHWNLGQDSPDFRQAHFPFRLGPALEIFFARVNGQASALEILKAYATMMHGSHGLHLPPRSLA